MDDKWDDGNASGVDNGVFLKPDVFMLTIPQVGSNPVNFLQRYLFFRIMTPYVKSFRVRLMGEPIFISD